MSEGNDGITRRKFIRVAGASGVSSVLYLYGGCRGVATRPGKGGRSAANGKKVIIIGIDGMDPRLCEKLMAAGELGNFARMRDAGGYHRLGSSIPPQSPVAWANFITGAGPGVHGIFDFIHRNPERQCAPYYAAAETIPALDGWEVGEHKIPLAFWPFNHQPAETVLRREGTPFWDYLDEAGIPAWFYDIPSNYPPSPSRYGHVCCLSGLGVPDLLGSYGTYQHFSEKTIVDRNEAGGLRKPLVFRNNVAKAKLIGPDNIYLQKPTATTVEFIIYRHPSEPTARIEFQDQTVVLKEGEWSDWRKVDFELQMPPFLPNESVSGICRFYLQEAHPDFTLYVTPINIDPSDPGGQKITEPANFITRLSDKLGLFYTTGFQEDHKALANKIFTDEEFRQQADYVLEERLNLLDYALEHYDDGVLFFYFSSTDVQAHMFWWDSDEKHPVRSADDAKKYANVISDLYKKMDNTVGNIARQYGDEATILVLSDHGFCNFRRQFNLNTWLRDNGYLNPPNAKSLLDPRRGRLVDWSRTKAYGMGLNGLYLNLAGREREGIVRSGERDALLNEIREKLLAVRDPADGRPVIVQVDRADQAYSGPQVSKAPDLIVGYHRGYRASWATTLGDMSEEVFSDNDSAWSADHCMASSQLPGVVFSNRAILRQNPSLVDLAPTILQEFGVEPPGTMTGGSLFTSAVTATAG